MYPVRYYKNLSILDVQLLLKNLYCVTFERINMKFALLARVTNV